MDVRYLNKYLKNLWTIGEVNIRKDRDSLSCVAKILPDFDDTIMRKGFFSGPKVLGPASAIKFCWSERFEEDMKYYAKRGKVLVPIKFQKVVDPAEVGWFANKRFIVDRTAKRLKFEDYIVVTPADVSTYDAYIEIDGKKFEWNRGFGTLYYTDNPKPMLLDQEPLGDKNSLPCPKCGEDLTVGVQIKCVSPNCNINERMLQLTLSNAGPIAVIMAGMRKTKKEAIMMLLNGFGPHSTDNPIVRELLKPHLTVTDAMDVPADVLVSDDENAVGYCKVRIPWDFQGSYGKKLIAQLKCS